MSQSNSRYNALDKLFVTVHSVRMPVGFGGCVKTMGKTISVMAHLKESIVEVKAADNSLVHALIITISRLYNYPNYNSYRKGWKIRPVGLRFDDIMCEGRVESSKRRRPSTLSRDHKCDRRDGKTIRV